MESSKRKDYLSWDEFFMGVAILSSGRSKDPNTQVGACIVDTNNRILSIGYNGTPNGFDDDLFPCNEYAKAIIQSGINEVIYLSDKYRDTDSNKASRLLFDKCGVTYRKIDLKTEIDIRLNSDKKITYRK